MKTYRAKDYVNAAIAQLAELLNITRAYTGEKPIGIDLETLDEIERKFHLEPYTFDREKYVAAIRELMSFLIHVLRDGIKKQGGNIH